MSDSALADIPTDILRASLRRVEALQRLLAQLGAFAELSKARAAETRIRDELDRRVRHGVG